MDAIGTKIAVLGSGYWGKNVVRNFHELGVLEYVCDVRDEALKEARARYGVKTTSSLDKVLIDPRIEGVVIATPAVQHYDPVRRCLLRGKDVYVEKPLALNVSEGQKLVELAAKCGRILMVGHILEYHPAIIELKRLIREGHLGCIRYIYSSQL